MTSAQLQDKLRPLFAPCAALAAAEARRVVLWFPVALGLGVQAYFLLPTEPAFLHLSAAVAVVAGVLLSVRHEAVRLLLAVLLCFITGAAAASLRASSVAAPVLGAETTALVEGRVRAVSQSQSGRPRLLLDAPTIYGLDKTATPARVRIALRDTKDRAEYRPGDWISVMARLSPPGGPVEPGAYDFARAAWFDRLGAIGVATGPVARLDGPPPQGPLGALWLSVQSSRASIGAALRDGVAGEAGAFAAAVAVGERVGLPPETLEALRISGLAHLLSISGLHMAIVCGLAYSGVRIVAAGLPGVGRRVQARPIAALAGLGAGVAYLGLSGMETPAQRAFVMAAVAFGALIAARQAVTMRGLALAATVVLVLSPEALLSVGFQMSFAATIALVAAYEAARDFGWLAAPRRWTGRVLRFVLATAATSLIAGLATAPFAAEAFNRVSVFSLPANLLGVPIMGVLVAPALVAAALLAPIGLEAWPLMLAGVGIDAILWIARSFAALPGADRLTPAISPWAIWWVTGGGLWLCLWRSRVRLLGVGGLVAAAVLGLAPSPRPDVLIAAGGQAIGIMTPEGRAVFAGRQDRFAAETWLRRDGDATPIEDAARRPGQRFGRGWRIVRSRDGRQVAVWMGADAPTAPPLRCGSGDVVAAPTGSATPASRCLRIDPASATLTGAVALHFGAEGVTTTPAQSSGRPWRQPVGQ